MKAQLKIESLAYQGWGVGRSDNMVWFVPYTVPGDEIEASSVEEKKSFIFGKVDNLVKASPNRIEATCPHFGECGGCHWQTTAYEEQLKAKGEIVKETLKRAGLPIEGVPQCVGAPETYGYRNRIQLRIDEKGQPGFFKRESHDIIPVKSCPLAAPAINGRLEYLWTEGNLGKKYPNGVELRVASDGSVEEISLEKRSETEYDFSQVNAPVNELLQEIVAKKAAELLGKDDIRVMDLFCGNGNFSIPLIDIAKRIRGWDISSTACKEGMRLAKEKGADVEGDGAKVKYFDRPLEKSTDAILRETVKADLIVVDPPRRGLKDQKRLFGQLKAPVMFYVSCSPPSLAKDIAFLKAKGWTLKEVIPFDMFPQTYHVETLAILTR